MATLVVNELSSEDIIQFYNISQFWGSLFNYLRKSEAAI